MELKMVDRCVIPRHQYKNTIKGGLMHILARIIESPVASYGVILGRRFGAVRSTAGVCVCLHAKCGMFCLQMQVLVILYPALTKMDSFYSHDLRRPDK